MIESRPGNRARYNAMAAAYEVLDYADDLDWGEVCLREGVPILEAFHNDEFEIRCELCRRSASPPPWPRAIWPSGKR